MDSRKAGFEVDRNRLIHYLNGYKNEKHPGIFSGIRGGMLMADMQGYECASCGNTVEVAADETKSPECCGSEMKPTEDLKACGLSSTAEHSRFDDFDEPCDDGRAG